jgi:(p)ppGpp synthase/HD superfamily hydrolase
MELEDEKRIHRAVKFVTKAHDGQFRKESFLPYIVHPMAVLSMIAEWEIQDPTTRLAALSHDVIEDCDVTQEQLAKVIGVKASEVVRELSFFPNGLSEIPANIQKQEYMRSFRESSVDALVIKVADRCCNTYDWVVAGNKYAKKYWGKASDLFSAMTSRREEIVTYFGGPEKIDGRKNPQREMGEVIFTKMRYTRTCIDGMVQ